LRGETPIRFRTEPKRAPRRKSAPAGKSAPTLDPEGEAIWTALRAWRLDEARRQQIPPYVIFHDVTLFEVARRRPTTLAALSTIPGLGRSKLDRYGAALLAITTDA
jgi:ATP-dependent DNA helicase RecQ